jgi:hypothetical protein
MSMMRFEWIVTPEDHLSALYDSQAARIQAAIYRLALRRAPEIENWMKSNARWTDRTGNARQTLHSEVYQLYNEILIVLGHGVDYGAYLEVVSGGWFAIVTPALDYWGPIIMQDVQRLLG